jgi:hypothetical protein
MLKENDINRKTSMCDLLAFEYRHECGTYAELWSYFRVHKSWSKASLLLSPTLAVAGRRSLGQTDGRVFSIMCACVCVWADIWQRSVCIFMRFICHIFHLVQQFNQHGLRFFVRALPSVTYVTILFMFRSRKNRRIEIFCGDLWKFLLDEG